eukprot:11163355-Lingulodinium_polyedra.AAC.1
MTTTRARAATERMSSSGTDVGTKRSSNVDVNIKGSRKSNAGVLQMGVFEKNSERGKPCPKTRCVNR